jgi:hypothetical protein
MLRTVGVMLAVGSTLMAQAPARTWLAFRADSNHVAVFFDVAPLRDTSAVRRLKTLAPFDPTIELPESYAREMLSRTSGEHFGIGDRYELSLDSGHVVTASVTGFAGAMGMDTNESYIGAIAVVPPEWVRYFTRDVYAAARSSTVAARSRRSAMLDTSVDAGTRSRIRASVQAAMVRDHPAVAKRSQLNRVEIQPFRLADGALRYYAVASWGRDRNSSMLAAWIDDGFKVRKSACECPLRESYPDRIVNVVTLPDGRTGVVVEAFAPGFFTGYMLYAYEEKDGVPKLTHLHTIGAGG